METATLRTLLIDFDADIDLNEATLVQIHHHLFETECFTPRGLDQHLVDHLAFLKKLIEQHEFCEADDLIAYFDNKKKRFSKFFDRALDEHDRAKANEAKKQIKVLWTSYDICQQGSFSMNTSIRPLIWSLHKKTFNDYLSDLLNYFKTFYSATLRNKLSHYEGYDFRLKNEYIECSDFMECATNTCEDKYFKIYLEAFTLNRNDHVLHLLKSMKPIKNTCLHQNEFFINKSENSYKMMPAVKNNYTLDSEKFMKSYQRILHLISQEKQITEPKIKADLAHFIYQTKFHRQNVYHTCYNFDLMLNKESELEWCKPENNFSHIRSFIDSMLKMKVWKVLKSPKGRSWITTDNPGIAINLYDFVELKYILPDTSLCNFRKDTMIYFPMSSKYCLRIQPALHHEFLNQDASNTPIEIMTSSLDEVELVNGFMLGGSNKVIIAKDKKELSKFQMT